MNFREDKNIKEIESGSGLTQIECDILNASVDTPHFESSREIRFDGSFESFLSDLENLSREFVDIFDPNAIENLEFHSLSCHRETTRQMIARALIEYTTIKDLREFKAFLDCGAKGYYFICENLDGGFEFVPKYCRSKLCECPGCLEDRRRYNYVRLKPLKKYRPQVDGLLKFLTLSQKTTADDFDYDKINSSLQKMIRWLHNVGMVGGVAVFEIKPTKIPGILNFHWHILMDSPKIDFQAIQDKWNSLIGEYGYVHIEAVKNRNGAVWKYVSKIIKYISKNHNDVDSGKEIWLSNYEKLLLFRPLHLKKAVRLYGSFASFLQEHQEEFKLERRCPICNSLMVYVGCFARGLCYEEILTAYNSVDYDGLDPPYIY